MKDTADLKKVRQEILAQLKKEENRTKVDLRVELIEIVKQSSLFTLKELGDLFRVEQNVSVKVALVKAMGNLEDATPENFLNEINEEQEEEVLCSLAKCLESKIHKWFSEEARQRDYSPVYSYGTYISSHTGDLLKRAAAIDSIKARMALIDCVRYIMGNVCSIINEYLSHKNRTKG